MSKPKALVTNDDGIGSYFLHVLVDALLPKFDVTVVAPRNEQSWVGRAISRMDVIGAEPYHDFACKAWAIDGTPTDCVNIALGHLHEGQPDIVISGINITMNASLPLIFSSGTVAGAIEGASWGIRSIAVSHEVDHHDGMSEALKQVPCDPNQEIKDSISNAAKHATDLAEKYLKEDYHKLLFRNVNYPMGTSPDTVEEQTFPGQLYIKSIYDKQEDGTFRFKFPEGVDDYHASEGSDLYAIHKGRISVSDIDMSLLIRSPERESSIS